MSQQELSLREELEAAAAPVEEVDETEETEIVVEAVEETEAEKTERLRDERGRFAKKETVEESAEPVEKEVPAKAEETPDEVTDEPEAPQQALAPPNGWTADAKAKWHELPAEVQAAVNKRELDVAKFTSKSDGERQLGIDVQKTLSPYMPMIHAEGGTPVTAIQSLLNTAYQLRTGTPDQKKALMLQTAQLYGVDLSNTEVPHVDPSVAALQQEIAQLKGLVHDQTQEHETNLHQTVQQEIETFAADPANPYFAQVRTHMGALMRADDSLSLQDAYDRACWANPDVRATLQAQDRVASDEKRRQEAKATATKAKHKDVSITGGPGAAPTSPAPETLSLREELEANMAASSGRI